MTHKHEFPHSSSIRNCTYDPSTKDMIIEFASGGRHKFAGVAQEDFDGFKSCESVGSYFHTKIRKAYKSERMED